MLVPTVHKQSVCFYWLTKLERIDCPFSNTHQALQLHAGNSLGIVFINIQAKCFSGLNMQTKHDQYHPPTFDHHREDLLIIYSIAKLIWHNLVYTKKQINVFKFFKFHPTQNYFIPPFPANNPHTLTPVFLFKHPPWVSPTIVCGSGRRLCPSVILGKSGAPHWGLLCNGAQCSSWGYSFPLVTSTHPWHDWSP